MNRQIKPKLQRFITASFFSCPICKEKLSLHENSLQCPQRHSFDLAKFGYVNLAPQMKQAQNYDKNHFQNRQFILEAGFYQHILESLAKIIKKSNAETILDVGCGEGYYTRKLQELFSEQSFYAFDISKESIQIAAKSEQTWRVNWFVGDLAHLPLQTASMDMILDIFSPANYAEFNRVLKENGLIVKVVPTENHLKEIRQLAQYFLTKSDYSNEEILHHFSAHCQILTSETVSITKSISQDEKKALLSMTPLLFHVDKEQIDWSDLTEVTIEAIILVGKNKAKM